jgi:thioredoxin 1
MEDMMSKNVIEINDGDWDAEVTKSNIPVVVDFWAEWCSPCKALAPVLDGLAEEFNGKIKVVSVNIDNNMKLAKEYSVKSIPTLIIFNGGVKTNDMMVGSMKKDAIKKILEKYV